MHLSVHVPMFGSPNIESKPIVCPCRANNWAEIPIKECSPGQILVCLACGKSVTINWGLVEPDHLSNWINSEHCPHRLCRIKYAELQREKGWTR